MTEQELLDLKAEVRRNVETTNFCADLMFRLASDVEREARINEERKLRDMARRFIAKQGRTIPAPLPVSAQIIPFPINRIRSPHRV